MMPPYALLRPLLFAMDPEAAQQLAIRALATGLIGGRPAPDPRLARRLFGIDFPNPIGLAAGFDKNAEVVDGALALGFGFVEVGTVTPLPQPGNARPRVFRLPSHGAIINRLGFNNDGFAAVHARLGRRGRGIVGVNVGSNRDSSDRTPDYVAAVARFADVADYLTINVSSPNTPGLRDLQERSALAHLLSRVCEARDTAACSVPLLLKIAPDLDDRALAVVCDAAMLAGIEGMIVSNTTVARDGLDAAPGATEAGGLSGRPLFRRSTAVLAKVRGIVGRSLVVVGVGGVDSTEAAWSKIAAGADLVQLYTGMIYEGPELPRQILDGLAERLDRQSIGSIADVVGTETKRWASKAPS